MGLKTRMFLLVALFFAILHGVITGVGTWMGAGSVLIYLILAFVFLDIQYLIGPAIVSIDNEGKVGFRERSAGAT